MNGDTNVPTRTYAAYSPAGVVWAAADDADDLYQAALKLALEGDVIAPRGLATREVLGPTFRLLDARRNLITWPRRGLNYAFSVAEWLWMLLGRNDVATIGYFNKNIAKFSDDGVTFAGAYGPRFAEQLAYVVAALRADPATRQAVLTFWKPAPAPSKDIPCTVSIQFLLRGGALHAHGFMRSNDAWLGFPYDLFNFTQLQAYVAALVGVPTGTYTHTVGSFHIYEPDWGKAHTVLDDPGDAVRRNLRSPDLTELPVGFDEVFTGLAADTTLARHLNPGSFPEPWGIYASVLAYRTHRQSGRVLPPYDRLLRRTD